jgi:hypothetical protein
MPTNVQTIGRAASPVNWSTPRTARFDFVPGYGAFTHRLEGEFSPVMVSLSNRRAALISPGVFVVSRAVSQPKRPLSNFPAGPQKRIHFNPPWFELDDFASFSTLPACHALLRQIALAGPQPPSH